MKGVSEYPREILVEMVFSTRGPKDGVRHEDPSVTFIVPHRSEVRKLQVIHFFHTRKLQPSYPFSSVTS